MKKFYLLLLGLCFVVGCGDFGGFDVPNEISPRIDTTINEDTETPTETQDTDETQDPDTFPGSVIIDGERAEEVIEKMDKEFWLSDKGVLHNSLCRWYKKCAGKVWDNEAEHTNCKNCGGDTPIVREWNLNKLGEEDE